MQPGRIRNRVVDRARPRRPAPSRDRIATLDLDLTTPSVQVLPSTVAAATAICGRTFAEIWKFTAASGNQAGTGANTFAVLHAPRYQATFPVWDGSSMIGTDAIEFAGGDTLRYMTFLNAAAYDLTQSLTWVFYGRLLRAPSGTRGWLGKKAGYNQVGYDVWITTTGRPELNVGDGTTTASAVAPASGTAEVDGFADGSPQWWAFKMNLTTGKAQILGLRAAGAEVTMPAGSKVSASAFRLGGSPYLFDCELLQIAWCGVLTGAEAEAFDLAALNRLDTTARVPTAFARYDRKSTCSPRVAYEPGFGERVQHLHGSAQSTGLVHVPHLFHPAATISPHQLGVYLSRGLCETTGRQKRNLFTRTDDLTHADWTKITMTATAGVGASAFEDPSGFTGATLLTATAGNARIYQTKAVESNQVHYHSVFVRRAGGADVAIKLRAVDADTATVIGLVSATATSEWTRVAVVSQFTSVNVRYELEIVDNGAAIYATFAQLERGLLTEYQTQRGTLVDRAASNYYIDNAAGYYDPRCGRVELVAFSYIDDTYALEDQYLFSTDTDPAVVNAGRLLIQISDPSGQGGAGVSGPYDTDAQIYDAAGTLVVQLGGYNIERNAEITYALAWNADGDAAPALEQTGSAPSTVGPVVPTGAWRVPVSVPRIYPGCRYTFGDPLTQSTHFEGGIERLRLWR